MLEAILLYIVGSFGCLWFVGKICGMNEYYEEQSRGNKASASKEAP